MISRTLARSVAVVYVSRAGARYPSQRRLPRRAPRTRIDERYASRESDSRRCRLTNETFPRALYFRSASRVTRSAKRAERKTNAAGKKRILLAERSREGAVFANGKILQPYVRRSAPSDRLPPRRYRFLTTRPAFPTSLADGSPLIAKEGIPRARNAYAEQHAPRSSRCRKARVPHAHRPCGRLQNTFLHDFATSESAHAARINKCPFKVLPLISDRFGKHRNRSNRERELLIC